MQVQSVLPQTSSRLLSLTHQEIGPNVPVRDNTCSRFVQDARRSRRLVSGHQRGFIQGSATERSVV